LGISPSELALIISVLRRYPVVRTAWIFGSRAKGIARRESDIDLALDGPVDEPTAARISGDLDELPLPHTFDVVRMDGLTHVPLREHIERVGVRIFSS